MDSQSPVAVVTGSSRGIGRAIAVELARSGWSVVVNYASNQDAAHECRRLCVEAATPHTASFEIIQADVSRREDRTRLLSFVQERFGWADLLVNNAGIPPNVRVDVLETTEESLDHLLAVNLKGPFFLTQMFVNWWIDHNHVRQLRSHPPKIVVVSSVSAYTASTNRAEYCISKAALSMLTRLFAVRLADVGINVYEVRPGIIDTDMTAPARQKYDNLIAEGVTPIRRWGRAADVGLAVRAIAEDRFPFSTGEVFNVDGGFHLRRL